MLQLIRVLIAQARISDFILARGSIHSLIVLMTMYRLLTQVILATFWLLKQSDPFPVRLGYASCSTGFP